MSRNPSSLDRADRITRVFEASQPATPRPTIAGLISAQIHKHITKYADAVIIVTDEPDELDHNLIEYAEKRDMPVHVHTIQA